MSVNGVRTSGPLNRESPVWEEVRDLMNKPGWDLSDADQERLVQLYRMILKNKADTNALARRQERYLKAIEAHTRRVAPQRVDRALQKEVQEQGISLPSTYAGLSDGAKLQLSVLLEKNIPPARILKFLGNPALQGAEEIENILRAFAELKQLGVRGARWAFHPSRRDGKLLENDRARIDSIRHEWRMARWLARMSTARVVAMDRNIDIDINLLPAALQEYIASQILPAVEIEAQAEHQRKQGRPDASPEPYRFKPRSNLSADIVCHERNPDGSWRHWITEVKSAYRCLGCRTRDRDAFKRLQLVRLAMAVYSEKMSGIELRLCTQKVDAEWIRMVVETLRAMKTPYLIHLEYDGRHGLIRDEDLAFSYGVYPGGDRTRMPVPIESVYPHMATAGLMECLQNQEFRAPVELAWIERSGRRVKSTPAPVPAVIPSVPEWTDIHDSVPSSNHRSPLEIEKRGFAGDTSELTPLPMGWSETGVDNRLADETAPLTTDGFFNTVPMPGTGLFSRSR